MRKPVSLGKVLGLLALLGALAGWAYLRWIGSPSYALRDLERSVRERDLAAFYTRIDLDRLVDSLIDAAATRSITQAPGDDWQNFQERFRAELSKFMKSHAMTRIKRDIEQRFSGGGVDLTVKDVGDGNLAMIRAFLLRADAWTLGSLSAEDRKARGNLILHIPRLDKNYTLVLLLEKGELWKVVGLEGLATAVDLFEKDAAAYVAAFNQAARDEMARLLPMTPGTIRKDETWLVDKDLYLSLRFRNDSGFPVRSIEGRVSLDGPDGRSLISYPFRLLSTDLAPGEEKTYSITVDVKIFDEKANEAFATENLTMSFQFEKVTFEGRQALRMISSLDDGDAAP